MTDTRTPDSRTAETADDPTEANRQAQAEHDARVAAQQGDTAATHRPMPTEDTARRTPREAAPSDDTSPATASGRQAADGSDDDGGKATPLFSEQDASDLRGRWTDVQAGFVDEPRAAVQHADALVAEVMKRLADGFAKERQSLEGQWSRGDDVDTEDLRVALRRYRSFFDRLLAI